MAEACLTPPLLSVGECQEILAKEQELAILPFNGDDFIEDLKKELIDKSKAFDDLYPSLSDFIIDDNGVGSLKKTPTVKPIPKTLELVAQIKKNMPERTLLDILCSTQHITGWSFEFGPLSGSEARFEEPINRYIINTFCYGTGMGPTQTAKHVRSDTEVTPHMLSWINQRHVTINSLNKAKDRVVNFTKDFPITKAWGDGSRCAADGTLRDIYEDNILAESHFRYMSKGGICYNHVADTYVALFSTFMRCGLWEAVAILDGLLQNDSTIKPTTIHADTQGQSTVVFGLAHLLGIKLMPRIRNWKNLIFYKADPDILYKNVDKLFSESIDWKLIKTHWPDLIQVVLSIKYGKISSALLLKKLGTYSRKNKLYQAFQELGRVIRTIFLLEYLSNLKLREIITATTNKVEAYNELSSWVFFADDVIVSSNDPEEMEKAIKYNLLISNCVILHNIIDLTDTIHRLQKAGTVISMEDMARLSPYLTSHIKRFGDFVLDLDAKPMDAERIKKLKIFD
ncbi:MAG: transposase [Alphaproteobacteria bacterium]|nr:transposase [Alphaproteobacteria bacterium]